MSRSMKLARPAKSLSLFGALLACVVLAGCGDSKPKPTQSMDMHSTSKPADELAKLAPADRDAAEKQVTCPISDKILGSMGVPVKLVHEAQEVFVCCDACKEPFEKDPAKYLSKVK